ncbi:MAG: 16S rRNA (cytosine(967)-C(5))-methyltransferase RsmB [Lachnospiraceae bacterium]
MVIKGSTRSIILDILMRVFKEGEYSHIVIRETLDCNMSLSKQDRAFINTVAEGTIERMIELDYIIGRYSSVSVSKMKPVILNILRSAVYQILYMDTVNSPSAVNEAVKLAQIKGFYNLKGFVNGILRKIAANIDNIPYPDRDDTLKYFSIRYSMPEWIVRMWLADFGKEVTEKMLQSFLERKPLTVRLKNSPEIREKTVKRLENQGITVEKAPYFDCAYYLKNIRTLTGLDVFKDGLVYVQDIGSMIPAIISGVKEGDDVIDVCAAPGGKSFHMADIMNNFGMIEARDVSDEKVRLIRENIDRLGLINIVAVRQDATVYDQNSECKADVLIADVPCSGLGVVGRKPDIKYRVDEDGIDNLVILQRRILHNCENYVKPGGVLIYSTCTVNRAENEENIKWFVENYPFELESIDEYLPEELRSETTKNGYIRMLPGVQKSDGFFAARFRRKK